MDEKQKKFIWFSLFFLILISPILYFVFNLALGFWGFKSAENNLKRGNFKTAQKNIFLLQSSVARDRNLLQFSKPLFDLLGLGEKFEKTEKIFYLGEVLSDGAKQTLGSAEEGNKVLASFLKGENINSDESLTKIKTELGSIGEKFSLAQSLVDNFSGQESIFGSYLLTIKKELPEWRLILTQTQEGMGILRGILGKKNRQTYLFLFQNNMELRPTGGFIGSYGLLTLEGGRLLDFEVQDVYWADGQLRGHVDPPAKLKDFLGTAGWYFRDSNWDPDFPTSAARGTWFLEKEIGRQVDGVVGLNLFVAQRILGVFGEVELVDFQEKVNAQNFFEKAQFHNEVGFFPGSTAKKDFLGALSAALFEKLRQANEFQLAKIILASFQSLLQRDILVYLPDEQASKILAKLGWDGAIRNGQCNQGERKCLFDYLLVNEANVGINKANYFLNRSLEVKTQMSESGQIEKKLTIFYENKSPSEIFPGGRYKSYLRIYVPEGSTLQECKIDDARLETCKVDQTVEHQKQVFGFLVEVSVGEKIKVALSWQLPGSLTEGKYIFLVQKQPGTKEDGLALSVFYPPTLKAFPKTAGGLTGEQVLFYNTKLDSDLIFEVDFKLNNNGQS